MTSHKQAISQFALLNLPAGGFLPNCMTHPERIAAASRLSITYFRRSAFLGSSADQARLNLALYSAAAPFFISAGQLTIRVNGWPACFSGVARTRNR
jgi:hypothetical protein